MVATSGQGPIARGQRGLILAWALGRRGTGLGAPGGGTVTWSAEGPTWSGSCMRARHGLPYICAYSFLYGAEGRHRIPISDRGQAEALIYQWLTWAWPRAGPDLARGNRGNAVRIWPELGDRLAGRAVVTGAPMAARGGACGRPERGSGLRPTGAGPLSGAGSLAGAWGRNPNDINRLGHRWLISGLFM